eukprot:1322239-Amorphochlora_amoeboformis.AAC.2
MDFAPGCGAAASPWRRQPSLNNAGCRYQDNQIRIFIISRYPYICEFRYKVESPCPNGCLDMEFHFPSNKDDLELPHGSLCVYPDKLALISP